MDYSGMNNSQSGDFLSFNESPGNHRRDRNNQYPAGGQQHGGFGNGLRQSFSPYNRGRTRSRRKRRHSPMPTRFENTDRRRSMERQPEDKLPSDIGKEVRNLYQEQSIREEERRSKPRSRGRKEVSPGRWNRNIRYAETSARNNPNEISEWNSTSSEINWRGADVGRRPEDNYTEIDHKYGNRNIQDEYTGASVQNRYSENRNDERNYANRQNADGEEMFKNIVHENRFMQRNYNENIHGNKIEEENNVPINFNTQFENRIEDRRYEEIIPENRILGWEPNIEKKYETNDSRNWPINELQDDRDQFRKQYPLVDDENFPRTENKGWDDNWYESKAPSSAWGNGNKGDYLPKSRENTRIEGEPPNTDEITYPIGQELSDRYRDIHRDERRSSNFQNKERQSKYEPENTKEERFVKHQFNIEPRNPRKYQEVDKVQERFRDNVNANRHFETRRHTEPGPSNELSHISPVNEDDSFQDKEVPFDKEVYGKNIDRLSVVITNLSSAGGMITDLQSKLIKQALTNELDKVLFSKNSVPPTFKHMTYTGGLLKISCENEYSRFWLAQTVSQLPPLWEEAKLILSQANVFSLLTKGVLFIPNDENDINMIKTRLAAQNSWADIRNWTIYHHHIKVKKNRPKGAVFIFGIPLVDVKKLVDRERKIHYGFVTLPVKLPATVEDLLYVAFDFNMKNERGDML